METKDLTIENLELLINMSCSLNNFQPDYLTFKKAAQDTPEKTFLRILWYSNFEFWEEVEFKNEALDFIYKKDLKEMPKYINENYKLILKNNLFFNWVTLIARWRLTVGR